MDPYEIVIVATVTAVVLAALRERAGQRFGAGDVALWLLLWVPFDLRWWNELYDGPGGELGYELWALYVTAVAWVGWKHLRRLDGMGLRPPRRKDLPAFGAGFLLMLGVLLPLGLLTGFAAWNPQTPTPQMGALFFFGIALTIALPEELFFRGILQNGLERRMRSRALALVLASLAFGIMHWNNADTVHDQALYFGLSSIAGVIYGLTYRWSGGLPAAVLLHTVVDWVWFHYLHTGNVY